VRRTRRAVAAARRDFERQAEEFVEPRLDSAQIKSFDDDDAASEQRQVSLEIFGAELLDRKVVEADEAHARAGERACGRRLDVREVLAEAAVALAPEVRVARLEEHARRAEERFRIDVPLLDGVRVRRNLDDARLADERVERERGEPRRALYEVRGGVDVRRGVRAEVEHRNVRRVAARNRAPRPDLQPRVARIGRRLARRQGHADVVNPHEWSAW
jgi:hypothetical protein